MKKSLIISIASFVVMVGCYIAYNISPNYIAEDVILVEPFGFIPLSFLFGFTGLISLIIFFYLIYND